MAHTIKILPSGHSFEAQPTESILEAGLRAGLNLNYNCDSGTCGECKARIVKGEVEAIKPHDFPISEREKGQGYALLCRCAPRTDLVIEAPEAKGVTDIPEQQVATRVKKLERLQDDLLILHLRTPRSQMLRFLAGQNARLLLGDNIDRVLPIASCPCNGMYLEFHLRRKKDDPFYDKVFEDLNTHDVVMVHGPCGELVLDEESNRPLIFIAYDTGFAAIKSLVEHALALELAQPMHFYWIGSNPDEHYLLNLCRSWSDAVDNFEFTAISAVSTEGQMDEAVCQDLLGEIHSNHVDISACEVYLTAAPLMVSCAEQAFMSRNLPLEQLHIQAMPLDSN